MSRLDFDQRRHVDADVPEHLARTAFVVGNGERLWPREAALAMVDWLANQQLGILGGEIYERREFGWGRYVSDWATQPGPGTAEHWSAYVERGRLQAAAAILRDVRDNDAIRGATRLFFLAYCAREEWGMVVRIDPEARLKSGAAPDTPACPSFGP